MAKNLCHNCGREITDPLSIQRGFGKVCYAKVNGLDPFEKDSFFKLPPKRAWLKKDLVIRKWEEPRVYLFSRDLADYAEVCVKVGEYDPAPVPHVVHHSPTGMEFGYGGSGPADCARSVLADCVGLPIADILYQDFKDFYISGIDQKSGGVIDGADILVWVEENMDKVHKRRQLTEHEIKQETERELKGASNEANECHP